MSIRSSVRAFACAILGGAWLGGCVVPEIPPTFEVLSPEAGSAFVAGDTITLTLGFENFELMDPDMAMPMAKRRDRAHDMDGMTHEMAMSINEGHYHIYLDDARGADPHITAWTPTYDYVLPDDLAPGMHMLFIELRDHHHMPIGVSLTWSFECVEP